MVGLYDFHHTPVPLHSYKSTLMPINYTTLTEQTILASCLFQDCTCYLLISHFNLRTGIRPLCTSMSKLQNSTLTMMCHNVNSTTPRLNLKYHCTTLRSFVSGTVWNCSKVLAIISSAKATYCIMGIVF